MSPVSTIETIARAARFHQSKVRDLQTKKSLGLPVDDALIGISRHLQLIQERRLEELFGMALTPDGDVVLIPVEVAA